MRSTGRLAVMAGLLGLVLGPALAEPTRVTVRVLSKDAKFIGTSMGGARVTIRDADTGELLAQGTTLGSTGDTGKIMRSDWKRGVPISTGASASFSTVLDLDEPRRIEVTAFGPQAQAQASGTVSVTQWVVPGKHLDQGDGILLVLPGFVVDVLSPPAHVKLAGTPQEVEVRINLTMM